MLRLNWGQKIQDDLRATARSRGMTEVQVEDYIRKSAADNRGQRQAGISSLLAVPPDKPAAREPV